MNAIPCLSIPVALAVLARMAMAAQFYPVVSVVSSTEATDLYPAANLIQGPGVGFDSNPPHDALGAGGAAYTWVTDAPGGFPSDYIAVAGSPVLTIDLGQDQELSEISVWGYADTNANGLSQFSLRFATAAEGTAGFGTSITYNPTFNPVINATPRQSFVFSQAITARYVELTGLATFYSNGGNGPPAGGDRAGLGEIAFEIITVAPAPNIDVPASLTLPVSTLVQTANITVRNLGAQPLTISSTRFTGTNASAFSVVSAPATLGQLESGNIQIRFDPSPLPPGLVSASLQIMSNDPDTPTAEVAITTTVPAAAQPFYPISGVTSSTEGSDLWPASNLIQGPGTGFDANQPHDQLGAGESHRWVTAACGFPCDYIATSGTPVLTFDLGEDRSLSEISVWGYTFSNANGLSEFRLQFATAAEGPGGFGGSISYKPVFGGLESGTLPNLDVPRFSFPFVEAVTARYVELTCLDNFFVAPGDGSGGETPGGDRVGLGEVAFAILEPVPAAPFEIIAVRIVPAGVSLTFNSNPGRTYAVWRSFNLLTWQELDDSVPSGGNETTYLDNTLGDPRPARVFYYVAGPP